MIAQPQPTAIAALRARPDVLGAEVFGDVIHLHYDGDLRRIERGVVAAGATISDSAIREPSLEDVFLELVGQADRRSAPTMMIRGSSTPGPAGNALSCRQVSRTFGAFRAVDDVTFDVCGGEIFGLLGPNGAGKTTLIKMLCGLLPISQGKVTLAGADVAVARAGIWRHVGYMSQKFSLYRDLTVRQNLALYADLYDVPHERCHQVLGRLNLDQWSTRLVRDLPTGLRQRLSLLCAVLHDPSVVFLDEPTSGVDPEARRLFWDLIYSLSREAGVTVVVSTHYMDEAEHCDRLALMHSGRLVALDSPRALRATAVAATGELLVVRCGDATAAWNAVTRVAPHAVAYGDGIHVRTHSAAATRAALAAALTAAGVGGTVRIDGAPLSMDETFVDFIEEAERQHA